MAEVTLSITASPTANDDLRVLRSWLLDEDEYRGRVKERPLLPEPGTMGPFLDALDVALGPGGAVTALTATVIVWLRQRKGKIAIRMSKGDNEVEIDSDRVKGLDAAGVHALAVELADKLAEGK